MPVVSFEPPKKNRLTGILMIVLYLATGVLLLIRPEWTESFTRWAVFTVLLVSAVLSFYKYLTTEPAEAAKGYSLTSALIYATLAVLALFEFGLMTDHIWGFMLLVGGFMKFQTAMDMGRLGHQRWWLYLIPSAISLVLGLLIVTNAVRLNDSAPFIGGSMIAEGVVDIGALIMTLRSDWLNRKKEKKTQKEEKTAEKAEDTAEEKTVETEENG